MKPLRDIGISGGIGLLVALVFFGVAKNLGADYPQLWVVVPALPLLSALGMAAALVLGRKIPVLLQFARFLLVGVLNTVIDLGALNLLVFLTSVFAGPWFSVFKGISFTAAVLNSYAWNKYWTFRKAGELNLEKTGVEFTRFLGVSVVGFLLNVGSATLVVNSIGPQFGASPALWANVGAVVAIAFSMLWNFTGYKLFVFKT